MNVREQEPSMVLPRDEFTVRRRELENHPEAVAASSRIDVTDPYGNVVTWVLDLYRLEGAITAFVQRGADGDYKRIVIPPSVTAAITRHQSTLVTKHRRKVARRIVADRRARGERVGNPEALAKARKERKPRKRKRRVTGSSAATL